MNKKVSIIIPTYNRAPILAKSIDASLSQTYPCEVIIVDHGSKDKTPEVVAEYGDKVSYIRREQDYGPHFCWLDGILNATGDYLHIQYDDDWIESSFIADCLQLMHHDVGMVFSDAAVVDLETGNQINICYHFNEGKEPTGIYPNIRLEKELIYSKHKLISPAACLFRKRDLIDAFYQGSLPFQINETYNGVGPDLFVSLLTVLRYKNFGYINKPLACYGSHENSITVDAFSDHNKTQKLINGYNEVKVYYLALKNLKKYNKFYWLFLHFKNVTAPDVRQWIKEKIKRCLILNKV